jgi:hypothetical protein
MRAGPGQRDAWRGPEQQLQVKAGGTSGGRLAIRGSVGADISECLEEATARNISSRPRADAHYLPRP